jgi:hypothetical protein
MTSTKNIGINVCIRYFVYAPFPILTAASLQSDSKLKIYYNVNSFSFASLEGKVHGYLGPSVPTESNDIRINSRRLLINPSIPTELRQDFRIDEQDLEPVDNIVHNDLEGSYEIIENKRLAILKYLNSVPFQDYNHSPPRDYKFLISLAQDGKKRVEISIGSNNH